MQKLSFIFVGIVLFLLVLASVYIRTSEHEKRLLRSKLATQEEMDSEEKYNEDVATSGATLTKKLGTIEGSLSFPSSGIPDSLEVCAENVVTEELTCTGEIQKSDDYTHGFGYRLEVSPAEYIVYARLPNDPYRAYYSDFVVCGLAADCPSHEPIAITVAANMSFSNIDPQDWYDTNQ